MGQDLGAIEGNGNERFIDEEIARQAPVGAAAKRPPAGLHPVRAWGACWREENRPGEVETMIPKKDENGEKYATATTEAEFHEALNRGLAVELTRELAERIGVPMNEDVGTVAEIDQARHDRHD